MPTIKGPLQMTLLLLWLKHLKKKLSLHFNRDTLCIEWYVLAVVWCLSDAVRLSHLHIMETEKDITFSQPGNPIILVVSPKPVTNFEG